MKIKPQATQEAFQVIGQLAALAATENISIENREVANLCIHDLMSKIIKPAVQELTAEASGLIVK